MTTSLSPYSGTINSFESLTKAQSQITSGNIAVEIREAPDAAKSIMIDSAEKQWATHKTTQLEQTNVDAAARETAIEQIIESATRISVLIAQANNDTTGQNNGFKENMDYELRTIFESLNTKNSNGDYLFAGTALKTMPADRSLLGLPATTGSVQDFSWFTGLNDAQITARDGGVEKIIRAAQMAYTSTMGPPPDHQRLSAAASLIDQGIIETSDGILAKSMNLKNQIEKGIDAWEDKKNTAEGKITATGQTSIMEKIMEIQNRNLQLQGDFIAKSEIREAMKALIQSIR